MSKPRGSMITKQCAHCACDFTARLADHQRGWARFCSKSCKARAQKKREAIESRPMPVSYATTPKEPSE